MLQHPSQVLPLLDLPRRERLEGSPGAPGSRNTTQKGHSGRLLSGPSTRGPAPTLTQTAFAAGLRTRAVTALADRPRNRCSGPRGSPGIAGGTACARVSGQPRGQPRASHHGGDHGRRQPETEVREDAREKTTPTRVRSCVENQTSGAPRHRCDVVPVTVSARWRGDWRGDSTPSTRRCLRNCGGSMAWRFTKVSATTELTG